MSSPVSSGASEAHPSRSAPRGSSARRRIGRRRVWAAGVAALTALAVVASINPSDAADRSRAGAPAKQHQVSPGKAAAAGRTRIILGADGSVGGLAHKISHPLARHYYRDFRSAVPGGRMLTAGTSQNWRAVAAMRRGSALYADVARWGRALGHRHRTTLFAFSHEPETTGNQHKGKARDFKRAFRKVVTVMRAHGARNVRFTWQMTGWSFRANPADRIRASKWYPGDRYVNVVGPDEYNWWTCGEGRGNWMPLGKLVGPALRFAARHHKKFAIPEFASFGHGAKRSRWVRSAHTFLAHHRNRVIAVFYFQHDPTNAANSDCRWKLTRKSEFRAFGAMARHRKVFRQ